MATAKPSRTRKQLSANPLTPAQKQRQRDQIARQRTEQLVHQAYERQLRQTKIAIARQQARTVAMKDAGIETKKKPSGRKPPRR